MYPMKNLIKGVICLSIFVSFCVTSSAQKAPVREPDMNRPSLFKNLPDKISCRVNELSALFENGMGSAVVFSITNNFNFQGVISSVGSTPDLQSIIVRSTNLPGASFSFSRIVKDDKTISYVGCIISFQHGDAYEINQENGQYYFVKKGFYDLINE